MLSGIAWYSIGKKKGNITHKPQVAHSTKPHPGLHSMKQLHVGVLLLLHGGETR